MKFIGKTFIASVLLAAAGMSASAGADGLSAGQGAFGSVYPVFPAKDITVSAPERIEYGLTRDVFLEVDACSLLNAQFFMQPAMKDALNMLKPCLAGVSALTGKAPIAAAAVDSGKGIEITVVGSGNKDVKELVAGALAKRNNQLFGYPSSVVLRAAKP